ncbi:MAG: 5-formyltetrahydrofolate cyclo-ligase [Bacteroidetes bacterium]|nr:5-formyltetrahydrofolate cyclo-ligase [Bacteroidota bacterium]
MEKSALREMYKKKRKALSTEEIHQRSEQIFSSFIAHFSINPGDKVHLFLEIKRLKEIETDLFLDYFFKHKIRVFVPKINGKKMDNIEIFPNTVLQKNDWGIPEPIESIPYSKKDFDLIITPLLYADEHGNRIGYGKGYYDQLFSEVNPNIPRIGLNYFEPKETISNPSPLDMPLHYLVLPNAVLSFGNFKSKFKK